MKGFMNMVMDILKELVDIEEALLHVEWVKENIGFIYNETHEMSALRKFCATDMALLLSESPEVRARRGVPAGLLEAYIDAALEISQFGRDVFMLQANHKDDVLAFRKPWKLGGLPKCYFRDHAHGESCT
jgi:hypothetical protein